jgi:hypothetical protein
MRHITDGELHAYLDGALDHLPLGRGEEVREHLEVCEICRERLEDEEEIRSRAEDLLAGVAPGKMPLPSFEDIRARAETGETGSGAGSAAAPTRRPGFFRRVPLGWAATVILALGVGWMGGQVWESTPPESVRVPQGANQAVGGPSLSDSLARESPQASVRPEGVTGGIPRVLEERLDVDEEALNRADALAAGSTDAGRDSGNAAESASDAFAAPPPGEVAVGPDRARVSEDVLPGVGARDVTAGLVEQKAAVGVPSAPMAVRSAEMPTPEEEMENRTGSRVVSDENSMAIPGLEVLSVEWEEWAPGERALYIRQLLPMGDTLELRYLGLLMGADPEVAETPLTQGRRMGESVEKPLSPKVMEASLPPGWNQVVMRWRRGWLVARAHLPTESLRGILRAVH